MGIQGRIELIDTPACRLVKHEENGYSSEHLMGASMHEPKPINYDHFLQRFSSPWPDPALREQIARHLKETRRCIVALDDDPTGTQTVHDIWVVTKWDVNTLRKVLADDEPAFYILTNTRSLLLSDASKLNREIGMNLVKAAELEDRIVTVVSRSDSTLRGHYPGEVDALKESLVEAGMKPFNGVCIIPFFLEGGRFTAEDIHWVLEGNRLIPAAQTPYAQDHIFGYRNSHLPSWVEEKTNGRFTSSDVTSINLNHLRRGGPNQVKKILVLDEESDVVIVNALEYRDLEVFACGYLLAENEGKHLLFRTAASFVKVAAGIVDKPLLTCDELVKGEDKTGGLIVVGSYVPKSTIQLEKLKELEGVSSIELPVRDILRCSHREKTIESIASSVNISLQDGVDTVVYTSREIILGSDHSSTISIGRQISSALFKIVQRVKIRPKYIIAKGGITSSQIATQSLDVRIARVLGQILPGVPVWRLGPNSRWPGLAYVIFPGNVGHNDALADIVEKLRIHH